MKKYLLENLIRRLIKEETDLSSSTAYQIFKRFGNRSGSVWAKTDEQDEKIDSIVDALTKAGFKRERDNSLRSYDSYLVRGDEKVYHSARTADIGLQALILINPPAPQRPPQAPKSKPEFSKSNLGNLKQVMFKDLQESGLQQWTAEQWRKSAESRGTFDEVDSANNGVGITMNELWPSRFHQIMKILINMGRVQLNKIGSKNVYSFTQGRNQ